MYISLQLDWLEDLINDSTLRNNAVNRANEKGCKMNAEESDLIKDKCVYLRQAYLLVYNICLIKVGENVVTWQ